MPIAIIDKLFQLSIIEVTLIFERKIDSVLDCYEPNDHTLYLWTTADAGLPLDWPPDQGSLDIVFLLNHIDQSAIQDWNMK